MNLERKAAKQGPDGGGQVKLRARRGQMCFTEGGAGSWEGLGGAGSDKWESISTIAKGSLTCWAGAGEFPTTTSVGGRSELDGAKKSGDDSTDSEPSLSDQ
ncbi:unnamed protein product [Cylindrotheca closterium]|uniref:Uncharacterized protein n=1 Tax=Cylindrotheca closterium TaxID=2856 RepID=A0AAD2JLZ1_9STRA|nr:unnamed protein product [Cylindrotheca closterium]